MSLTENRPSSTAVTRPTGSRLRRPAGIVATLLVTLAVWAVGHLAGADYVITDPTGSARIDLVVTAGFTLVVALVGWVVLALLERLTRRGTAIWTVLAVVVLVASYVPVFLVEATTGTRIALVAVHTAVGLLVPAFRR
ncbi:DUF6069 family protein [Actinomycetospora atypica]|uniref:DUF6069 family protein n=1 Tax=Actinomycetospora atypica TaxID=1290095 RepID=A0ABV9YJT1_9PSEU